MQWYYATDLVDDEITLSADEAHHLVHVVRMQQGDNLLLTDGKGLLAEAKLIRASSKDCRIEILNRNHHPAPAHFLHLAFAPTKNIDRVEWLLEKATEMGVMHFTPLRCRHSERKDINAERLQKIILSASKQSRRVWFPQLHPLKSFNDFVNTMEDNSFIAHCNTDFDRKGWDDYLDKAASKTVMIGPEGDFAKEEIELAYSKGVQGLYLGEQRLRTETAALAVCFPLLLSSSFQLKST